LNELFGYIYSFISTALKTSHFVSDLQQSNKDCRGWQHGRN